MVAVNIHPERNCDQTFLVNALSGASIVSIKPVCSYDSQYIILSSRSIAKVFAVKSGENIQTLSIHTKPIISIRLCKKNNLQVYTCSDDGLVVRWDYIEGQILQVYDLKMNVSSFYAPSASGPFFVSKKFEDPGPHRLYSLIPHKRGFTSMKVIIKPVDPRENTVDFGFQGSFCASVFGNTLTIHKCAEQSIRRHKTGERVLTCVACHPSDYVVATGDDNGRILVWTNALASNHPIRSIYHWHTLPLADLAFTPEGCYLYSGGGEAALVKWGLFSEERFVLPRMGSPILFLSSSSDGKFILTAHQDNVLQVVDAQRRVVQVIQGLTRSAATQPIPLLFHPKLQALILNGKPGHLQFYDVQQDKQLFNLDICGQNLVSQERDIAVFNMDIQRAAVDETGFWMATAEFWSSGDSSPQMWLKFWMFDQEKQIFVLNTNVILPHSKEINCILFRPRSFSAVTTSSDGRFKIWTLSQSEERPTWSCESMGCYRGFPAGEAVFSDDGSLLAVAFANAATVWEVDTMALKAVLCPHRCNKHIKQLLFGHHSCSQYLLSHDGLSITAWNVLTLSVTWVIHNEVQVLTSDPISGVFAAFCKNQNLVLFSPNDPKPLHCVDGVSNHPILSAVFSPLRKVQKGTCSHSCLQLLFIDGDQNLLSLSEDVEDEPKIEKRIPQRLPLTPFGMLQAERKISDVKQLNPKALAVSLNKDKEQIIQNPTLQNPLALCSKILPNLLIHAKNTEKEKLSDNGGVDSDCSATISDRFQWMPINLNDIEPKCLDFDFLSHSIL